MLSTMTDVEKLPGSGNINNRKSVGEEREREGGGGKSTLIQFLVNTVDGMDGALLKGK